MPINFTSIIASVIPPTEATPNTETSPKSVSAPVPSGNSIKRRQAPRPTSFSQELLRKARTETTNRAGKSKEENQQLLATLAVTGEPIVREIARELMRAEGLQLDSKKFEDFERPGFSDLANARRQAVSLLSHAFSVETAAELAAAVATAAVRVGSRLQRAAEMAIESGIVPRQSAVGNSTIAKELQHFRISVGF